MMSGWTGYVYQTAWTLDFASERSDAKSHVRNRQDGPDIMHLRRTRNVRFSNIVEQSPFLSWTDGLAIKTPNQSPEFDTRLISSSRMASNALPLGGILRTTPLRISFVPRSYEWYGFAK